MNSKKGAKNKIKGGTADCRKMADWRKIGGNGGKWRIRRSGGTAESAIFRRFGHYPQKHNKKYKKNY